jgi:hypothetical protein
MAKLFNEHGIHAAAKVGAVLLSRADRQDCGETVCLKILGDFLGRAIGPEHDAYYSTSSPTLVMRVTIG